MATRGQLGRKQSYSLEQTLSRCCLVGGYIAMQETSFASPYLKLSQCAIMIVRGEGPGMGDRLYQPRLIKQMYKHTR